MGNPEKGPGKLGHEGKGNEKPSIRRPNSQDAAKKLGQTAVKGSQKK